MAKKVFSVPEVPGSKRSSDRPYSHAVIGRYSGAVAAELAEAWWRKEGANERARDIRSWNYNAADAKRAIGEVRKNHNGYPMAVQDYEVQIAQDFIAKFPSVDAYLASKEASHKAYIEKLRADGLGPLVVLRWSMSMANAMKAWNSEFASYVELRVVPCVEVVKEKA